MKNYKKGFVGPVILAIIALLVIGGGVYVYENKKAEAPVFVNTQTPVVTDTTNSLINPQPNAKVSTGSDYTFPATRPDILMYGVPSPFNGLKWTQRSTTTENYNVTITCADSWCGATSIPLAGREWLLEKSSLDLNAASSRGVIEEYFDTELAKLGWTKWRLRIANKNISGMVGDGRFGGSWSYLKLDGGLLYDIRVSHEMTPKGIAGPDEMDFNCPCDVSLRIFVSDPIPVDKII